MEQVATIATEMNAIRALPNAEMEYFLFADAIVWSDEYPMPYVGRSEDFECLKILWRYRTSLLTGNPSEQFKPYWDRAIELFPRWAGFAPERLLADEETTSFYERHGEGN